MWTWLLLLTPVVAVAVLVWNYRRQVAAREAASAERMKEFVGKARGDSPLNPAAIAAPTTPVAPARRGSQPPPVSGIAARSQLLSAEQAGLYRLLKSALPEHEIFPRMSLSAFIQPAENMTGFTREAQVRRLAEAMVDFLICDRTLKPVAAVHYGVRSSSEVETVGFAAACVAAVGVRWMEISPEALPVCDDLRALVLGA